MTTTTISGTVSSQVTPGAGNYAATLTIAAGGTIDTGSNSAALWVLAPATVENDGVILTTGNTQGAAVLQGGPALLQNNGTIDGVVGVYLSNGDTLINTGLVTYSGSFYGGDGVQIRTGGALFNSGTIIGVAGIDADAASTLQNTGVVYGWQNGVVAAASNLYNTGSIGGGQTGVIAGPSTTNTGSISGGMFGVIIENAGYALNNAGSIFGGREGVAVIANGVQLTNAGYIGGATYALYVVADAFDLTVLPGASFTGLVTDLDGDGTLILGGTTAATLDIDSFTGFSSVETLAGSDWTLEGSFGSITTLTSARPVSIISGPVTLPGPLNIGTAGYADSLTITSTGRAEGAAAGVYFAVPGTLANAGHVSGTYAGAILAGGALYNAGHITASGSVQIVSGSAITSSGTGVLAGAPVYISNSGVIGGLEEGISLAAGGVVLNTGTIAASGTATQYAGAYTFGPGTAILNNTGAFTLIAGTGARFTGAVTDDAGDGALTLASGAGVLDIDSFSGFSNIDFATGAAWLLEGSSGQLAGGETISGFTAGDTIMLDGFAATDGRYYGGFGLVLSNGGGSYPMLHFADGATGFDIATDGTNTTITAACFCTGTRIATPGGEVPVEDLCIGDEVLTLHAGPKQIKWIGRRSYAAPFADGDFIRPLRIRPGALGEDIPRRALHVSPGHALFLGGALVPGWRLLNGASVTQALHVELVEYYHIELDAQEVIFAEGCPVESYIGAELRGQFHNAAEFSVLYPNAADQSPCLTLLEEGFALEAVQRQVAARAGLPPAMPHTPGALRGFVDVAGPESVEGWAQDEAAPEAPVALDITRDGRRIGRVLANRYRADLRLAGIGSGCHAFRFLLPPGEGNITVTRIADGAILPLTDEAAKVA